MNKAKALLGWNAGLVNGRDFRVEDHLDGNGQAIVWLADAMNPPGPEDLEAGWATWRSRSPAAAADPIRAVAAQVEIILHALGIPAAEPFECLLDRPARATPMKETEHDR